MIALVREVSERLAHCELSFLERAPIDAARARAQHAAYVAALGALGLEIEWLEPLAQNADGVFVEDTALVLPEVAVITRPGVESRRGETASVAAALAAHRPLRHIVPPGTLEGGDIVVIGRSVYVGASARSNAAGIAQLAAALAPFGYRVAGVAMRDCLHLKSAVTFIAPETILVNPAWVDPGLFDARAVIAVDPAEAFAANTLSAGGVTLVSAAFPRTEERLRRAGITTRALDVRELQKAEAALTCMSLIVA
ncbi:MAG: dimethylargininase [Gammaproteobacteria bacterium]|nr:dimethylargininase [Gammaproteobacteria bacterium]